MSTSFRFTKTTLDKLAPPAGKPYLEVYDTASPGLSLRIGLKTKTYYFRYRLPGGEQERVKLGSVAQMTIDEARAEGARLTGLVRKQVSPRRERKVAASAPTFAEKAEAYLTFAATKLKPGTLDQSKRNLMKYAASLHQKPLASLKRSDIAALHDKLTETAGPIQANRTRSTISAFLTWAERRGDVEVNVAMKVPDNDEKSRERVLNDAELAAIWTATSGPGSFDRIVRLALLTGCRRSELGGMRWSEIDLAQALWTIPAARMKAGIAHTVPLSQLALAQLPPRRDGIDHVFGEKGTAFSGWSRCKDRLDVKLVEAFAGAEPWSLHDLRRSVSTRLNGSGVAPHIVEAILAHRSFKAGVAGVYNRAQYAPEKRAALEMWANRVATIVGIPENADLMEEGSVVPLRRPGGDPRPVAVAE